MLCAALLSWGSCSYVGAWVSLQLVQLLWKLSQNTGAQVGAAFGHGSAHAVGEEIIHTAHSNRTEHAKHISILFYDDEPDAYQTKHASFLGWITSCSRSLLWSTRFYRLLANLALSQQWTNHAKCYFLYFWKSCCLLNCMLCRQCCIKSSGINQTSCKNWRLAENYLHKFVPFPYVNEYRSFLDIPPP